MDLIIDEEKLVKMNNNNNKLLNNNNPIFKAKDEIVEQEKRPESENSLRDSDGQPPASPISLSPTVSETIYEFGSHFENSNQVISEKVKNLASQIYNELQKVMARCNDDEETVGGLMSLIVSVLESLDLALIENQQLQVELELCKDDNEQLVTVFEKEKQSKKKVEQKLFEFEFTTEEEKQQYQQRIDSLANIVKMLELKAKNASDHSTRLEEKESELRKDYNKLHERNTELLRSHCDLMERFKIMFGADADPTSNNIVQLTNLFKQNLQRLSADGEEVAFTERLNFAPRESTESNTQQAQKASPFMKNASAMDNCWTMEQEMSYDDTTTICEDVEELQRDKDKEHSLSVTENFFGMEKEIENLITENNELLATKNALNIVKDDLIAKVDELQGELLICSNEIQQRDAVQTKLKSRVTQMEEELKKYKEELEQTKQKLASMNEDDEEGVPMAQRKRFTRVEMSRVLMERNNFKEKYFELQDALRWSELSKANRMEDKRSGNGIWKFFSNFFGPSGNGTIEVGDVNRGNIRNSTGASIRYSANPTVTPALEAMRRRAKAQQNSDLVLMMDSDLTSERTRAMKNVRAHVTRTTSGDRVQAYGWSIPGSSNSNSDTKTVSTLKSASVPVPIYCRPLGGEDIGMKIWCATAVDLTGGEAGFPISDAESVDSDKSSQKKEYEKDSLAKLESEINEAIKERKDEFKNDQNLSTYVWICSVSHSKSKVTIVNIRSNPGEVLDSFFIRTHLLCTTSVPGAKTNDLLGSSNIVIDETVPELKLKEVSKRNSLVHSNTEPNLHSSSGDNQSSSERRVHFADENKSSSKSSSKEDIDLEVAKSVTSASVPIGEPNSLPARSVTLEKLTEYVAYKSPPSPTNLSTEDGEDNKQKVKKIPSAASSLPIQPMSTCLPTMWLGGQNGILYVHSGIAQWSHCIATIHLSDSILQIVHYRGRVFVALANGQCCIFVRSENTGEWDFEHYYVLDIGIHCSMPNNSNNTGSSTTSDDINNSPSNIQQTKTAQFSIRCLEISKDTVWLGYRNSIFIVSTRTLRVIHSFVAHPSKETYVRQLVALGDGVWCSFRLDSTLRLYSAFKPYQHVQNIDVEPYVSKMVTAKSFNFVRITSLKGSNGRLWIGTSNGVILCLPCNKNIENSNSIVTSVNSTKLSNSERSSANGEEVPKVTSTNDPISSFGTFLPVCDVSSIQLSFHGHKDNVKFFVCTNSLILSGGEGYVDFRVNDVEEAVTAAASGSLSKGDRSHLIVWEIAS